jgi:hypothetical protein
LDDGVGTSAIQHAEAAAPGPSTSSGFHWSQLESTNFPTYVANLRAIGCPEQTVRDLVTAEIQALYLPVWRAIGDDEKTNGRLLEVQRKELGQEQARLVAQLLGQKERLEIPSANPGPTGASKGQIFGIAGSPASRSSGSVTADVTPPSENEPDAATKPASRWRQVRSEADEQLRILIGDQAFLRFERERYLSTSQGQ